MKMVARSSGARTALTLAMFADEFCHPREMLPLLTSRRVGERTTVAVNDGPNARDEET